MTPKNYRPSWRASTASMAEPMRPTPIPPLNGRRVPSLRSERIGRGHDAR